MRVAILYSGQLRNFEENMIKQESYESLDVFVSGWTDRGRIDEKKLKKFTRTSSVRILGRDISFRLVSLLGKYSIASQNTRLLQREDFEGFTEQVSLRRQEENFHLEIDGVRIPEFIVEAAPIYFRGVLSMMERNYNGLKLIETAEENSGRVYDVVVRTQGDYKLNAKQLLEFLGEMKSNRVYYEAETVNPKFQVSTKCVFAKRDIMAKYLSVFPEYEKIVSRFRRYSGDDKVPVGERFYHQFLSEGGYDLHPIFGEVIGKVNRQKVKVTSGVMLPDFFARKL